MTYGGILRIWKVEFAFLRAPIPVGQLAEILSDAGHGPSDGVELPDDTDWSPWKSKKVS